MKNQFFSNQHQVTPKHLADHLEKSLISSISNFSLWDISVAPAGHGHYTIVSKFNVDEIEFEMKAKTSNMQLIDAWKSGMNDNYETGEDGFDNWDEVVKTMLNTSHITDLVNESYEKAIH